MSANKQIPSNITNFIETCNQHPELVTLYIDNSEIPIGRNGSKIHIKKKNRGSFTRWCGGNVTDECIRRGKNSSNPKIRKKATFAANARKWKH